MTMDPIKSSTMHIRHRDGWFHSQIDPEDAEAVCNHRWHVISSASARPYVTANVSGVTTYLHRFLTDAPKGMDVDHKDGDVLNNRKENLRVCTRLQNLANTKRTKPSVSGYRGVYRNRKRWAARIGYKDKLISLGTFDTKEEAARVYNYYALAWRGEFAVLNEVPE